MAFFRIAGGVLRVTGGPGLPVHAVLLDAFEEALLLRWCGEYECVLAAGAASGEDDARLYRWWVGDEAWQEVHGGYVADAVGLGEGWVVHDGRGLAFLDADGEVAKRVEVGRFNPGPPSLSVSPDGERIAWIRWRGDDRRICTQRVDEDSPREYGVSCHRYAWRDGRSLVFYLNGPLRVLDVETGEASILLEGVTAARGRRLGHRTLDRYLTGRVPDVEESFAEIAVADRRVWFGASIVTLSFRWWWLPRFHGVFSIGLDGGDLRLVATVPRQEQVRDVVALAGGTVVVDTERYRRMRVVDRRRCQFGPLAAFLADGWSPMPTSSDPEFGFRLA